MARQRYPWGVRGKVRETGTALCREAWEEREVGRLLLMIDVR